MRTVGQLRRTGQESDRQLHLALNAGIPLPDSAGGFYLVFMAGELVYERTIQGREIDDIRTVQELLGHRDVGTTMT